MDAKSLLEGMFSGGLPSPKDLAENLKKMAEQFSEFKFALSPEILSACEKANRDPNEFLPTKSEPFATGWDLRCGEVDGVEIGAGCYKLIDTGLRMIAPLGFWAELRPRSSTFTKLHLNVLNGVIDNNYTGSIRVACQWLPDACKLLKEGSKQKIAFGDRIAQIIPHRLEPISVVKIDEETFQKLAEEKVKMRNPSGFGSSGVK
jgi:dUTP pyrophosphatase